jgi:hypothetical protein
MSKVAYSDTYLLERVEPKVSGMTACTAYMR